MTKPWLSLSIVVGLALMLTTPVLAGFQAGLDARTRGAYDTALKEWRPLAEQGLSQAQYNLGLMYAEGEGMPQDYPEAVRWYRQAAEQGQAEAQYNLGNSYILSRGLPKDYVLAHMWMNFAAVRRNTPGTGPVAVQLR